eukprot:3402143-Lingulodinium_polyedra.AAC.1
MEHAPLLAVAVDAWRKPVSSADDRSKTLAIYPSSPAVDCERWNTHCASTLPYANQIALPPPGARATLVDKLARGTRAKPW